MRSTAITRPFPSHRVLPWGTVDEVKAATEKLEKAGHKAAEELYKGAGQQGGPGSGPGAEPPKPGEPKKDDVVDAEFKQV